MNVPDNEPIVAFTLAHYPAKMALLTMAHLGLDRRPLMQTHGLRFWRLLGVGKGRVFDPHADFQRSALFTVWDSQATYQDFMRHSPVMRSMCQRADEMWTVLMRPVQWHGLWGGRDPFVGIPVMPLPDHGPWIVLTRATLRATRVRPFLKAVPDVAADLLQQRGLLTSVGVGEAPLLYQATVSIWRSLPAITSFAYKSAPHKEVIRRTRQEGWYREELFARLRPIFSIGTWDGVNPLADLI